MFKKLLDFGYKRTPLEALGFYIVALVLCLFLCSFFGGLNAIVFNLDKTAAYTQGFRVGIITATIFSLGVSGLIIGIKKLYKDIRAILLFILSGVLAFLFGGLIGIIPVAVLTTFACSETDK